MCTIIVVHVRMYMHIYMYYTCSTQRYLQQVCKYIPAYMQGKAQFPTQARCVPVCMSMQSNDEREECLFCAFP